MTLTNMKKKFQKLKQLSYLVFLSKLVKNFIANQARWYRPVI
jgi:hypothetical protein